jgi:hypothetical protein
VALLIRVQSIKLGTHSAGGTVFVGSTHESAPDGEVPRVIMTRTILRYE